MSRTRRPGLSRLDKTIFEFIVSYKSANDGNSPSVREIAGRLATSTSMVDYYLARLEQLGLLERRRDGSSRNIHIIGGAWTYESNSFSQLDTGSADAG